MNSMKHYTLVLALGFVGLNYANEPDLVSNVILRVDNKTNKKYRISTSQKLEYKQSEHGTLTPHMVEAEPSKDPINSGISAGDEKSFKVTLLPSDPADPSGKGFFRKLYLIDESGGSLLEVTLEQIINPVLTTFAVLLEHIPTGTQPHFLHFPLDVTKGKADFVVQLTLKGDTLQNSKVEVTAVQ